MTSSTLSFGEILREYRKNSKMTQLVFSAQAYCDSTHISRVENGKVTPNAGFVEAAINILRLNGKEEEKLRRAFKSLVMTYHTINDEIDYSEGLIIDLIESLPLQVKQLRLLGTPHSAISTSNFKVDKVLEYLQITDNEAVKEKLRSNLSHLYVEIGKSYMDYLQPEDVWTYMTPIIEQHQNVADSLKNSLHNALVLINKESAYYVSRDHNRARKLSYELMNFLDHMDADWKLEIARGAIINAGIANDKAYVNHLSDLINGQLESYCGDIAANGIFLLEGVARAQITSRHPKAETTLYKAYEFLNSINVDSVTSKLREVQLIRTELEYYKSGIHSSPSYIEKIGSKALNICNIMGYKRHETQITNSLDSLLNI